MIVEEIARLTGTLKFNVDNRPLMAFEKRLNNVIQSLNSFAQVANKKFQIKVSLDSRTLRAQLEKAANAKILFKNFSVDNESLSAIADKLGNKLENTPIRLSNVKIDVAKLVEQKKFLRTSLGQIEVNLQTKVVGKEKELRQWVKDIEDKLKLRIRAEIVQAQFDSSVRRSIREASLKAGALKVKVADADVKLNFDKDAIYANVAQIVHKALQKAGSTATPMKVKISDPQLELKVDRVHLQSQLEAIISQKEYTVRVRPERGLGGSTALAAAGGGLAGSRLASAGMGFARGALPGLGAAWAFSNLNQINQQLQAQDLAMTAITGSQEAGKVQSEWVKNLSNEIGLDYRQVAPSFGKMLASGTTAGMTEKSVQNIFQGVSEYGRTMGLDTEAMKGSMRAIEQMMNKGQVMSEELKGQLAERLPGAMSAMAEAAGFGKGDDAVAKLMKAMENGEVKSKEVLEKFSQILAERARQGDALTKAMQSTAAQQARMNNAFSDAVTVFSAAGFDKGMGRFFMAMAEGLEKAQPTIEALGEAFLILVEPINAIINSIAIVGNALAKFAPLIGLTSGELFALGGVIASFFIPYIGPMMMMATAIGAVALAFDDLATYAEGGDSVFGRWLEKTPEAKKAMEELSAEWVAFKGHVNAAWEAVQQLAPALQGLSFSDMLSSTIKELAGILGVFNSLVERFVNAGEFAQKTGGDSMLEQNLRNIQALIMGKEWTDAFLTRSIDAKMMADSNLSTSDVPGGKNSLATQEEVLKRVAEAILAAQQETAVAQAMTIDVKVPITVEGMIQAGDLAKTLEEPMKQAAKQAFGEVALDIQSRQKDIK